MPQLHPREQTGASYFVAYSRKLHRRRVGNFLSTETAMTGRVNATRIRGQGDYPHKDGDIETYIHTLKVSYTLSAPTTGAGFAAGTDSDA